MVYTQFEYYVRLLLSQKQVTYDTKAKNLVIHLYKLVITAREYYDTF